MFPKAVECRAEHLLADGRNVIKAMGIRAGDINLAVIPLGHSYGLGNLVMPLILQGTAMVCAGDYVPRQLIEWIGRYRVTVFPAVPALLRVLAALPRRAGRRSRFAANGDLRRSGADSRRCAGFFREVRRQGPQFLRLIRNGRHLL